MPNPWNIQILYACWNPNLTLQRPFLDLPGPQGGQSNLQAKFHHIYRAGQDVPALLTGLRASAAPWTYADPLTTLSVTLGFPDVPRHPLPLVCPLLNIYEAQKPPRLSFSVPTHHAPRQCGLPGPGSPAVSDGSPAVPGGILKLHLYTHVCCVCIYLHRHCVHG